MATEDKSFRIKNGLVVEGSTATVNGNSVLTTASSLDSLQDVNLSGATNTDILSYIDGVWVPSDITAAIGPTGPQGEIGATGPTGPIGDDGFIAQAEPPANTSLLWLDTDAPASIGSTISVASTPLNWYADAGDLEGIAYDSKGYAYGLFTTGASAELAVVKIAPDGSLVFIKFYNYAISYGQNIFVDSNDNIYLGIYSGITGQAIVKLSSNGDIIWAKTLSSNFPDILNTVADSIGNVYSISPSPAILVKYSSSGSQLFLKRFPAEVNYSSLSLDPSGNPHITGTDTSGSSTGIVIKYSPIGTILWQRDLGISGSRVSGRGIATDSNSNSYVVLDSYLDGITYSHIVKYDSSGTILWQKKIDLPSYYVKRVATDDNYVYLTGGFYSGTSGTLVIKLTSTGDIVWARNITNNNGPIEYGQAINVYGETILISVYDTTNPMIQISKNGDPIGTYSDFIIQSLTVNTLEGVLTDTVGSLVESSITVTDTAASFTGPVASTSVIEIHRIYPDSSAVSTGAGNSITNVAISMDSSALTLNTTGVSNIALGANSLASNLSGSYNTAVGRFAIQSNTSGIFNTGLGYISLEKNINGNFNTGIGSESLRENTTGGSNTAVGVSALKNNTTASNNTAVGRLSLTNNTTGYENVAVGSRSLFGNTQGAQNTAVGYSALDENTITNFNTAIGANALQRNLVDSMTAVGYNALANNTTGAQNTAVGYNSLKFNTTGFSNTAIGLVSLAANTTGSYNVGVGQYSLNANIVGISNTALGTNTLRLNTASSNTAVGSFALESNTTGSNNTALGYQSGATSTNDITTGSNNTLIGYQAQSSSATVSNEITLGNSQITTIRAQVTSITSLSDIRDKTNIESIPVGLDFINDLKPVKFEWNMRDGAKVGQEEGGFIAQELLATEEKFNTKNWTNIVLENNPDKLEAAPGKLIPILVKAIQELSARIEELENKN